ncbi:type 1 hydrophobin [Laccaria bicolor S238N-H82]|uniref:Hydrophobin n=1 Tax=Laccaria bicolor (strain S238N-H82 / ATCC MYA-4686) TaxID=486041 RepID=B0E180_LACBS|nr:type 1 hydrophobin [Laccaria bicolor S238N-H82]EDQ99412.1 type 1 hydrophobin [Laccaria bicolor S238N-H82]|eukprot:XP_001889963.1 type 1 hydrophobin [Laccaria bicolor S238N-H82]
MFSKVLFVAATLATFVAATPVPDGVSNSCNTGSLQCCNQTFSSTSGEANLLGALLNLNLGQLTGQIGLSCTPISVIGLGQGASCTQQPVCCSGNTFNGLINVGCTPISL